MDNTNEATLDLVFLWHMHQPDYRDHGSPQVGAGETAIGGTEAGVTGRGEFVMPWVYLHALKDYSDMAAHLERHPKIRCVVNFVPVLLEQIEDYVQQFECGQFRDPLLRLLATDDLCCLPVADRNLLLQACFRSNHHTMLRPFPHYIRLLDVHTSLAKEGTAALDYLSGAYFSDLLTWYHLAWTGEDERRKNPLIARLMSKGEGYNVSDRRDLLGAIGAVITGIIPRFRALAARGQIDISSTPQTHPLSPLLLDFAVARESQPDAPLPFTAAYPGGLARVRHHIERARVTHAERFGAPPTGMWPAEGALSQAFVRHLAQADIRWLASGEGVLRNSLHACGIDDPRAAFRPWALPDAPGTTLFFRDERLSDLIGFDYAKWHGRDAAQHLVGELEAIRAATPAGEKAVVGIILDGENAWEHYPYNGYYFFDDLYGMLAEHTQINTTTYADILEQGVTAALLPKLVAGSWVYGTLSTWIGDVQKNRAWDLLCAAKQSYDRVVLSGRLSESAAAGAAHQLAVCESSDWFWWFGDYNPATAVAGFDRLYRRNLRQLYHFLELTPPTVLDQPISAGNEGPDHESVSGAMRRATPSGR